MELIKIHGTSAVATPVVVEFIAGISNSEQMRLALAFLDQFHAIDETQIPKSDWEDTLRIARRIPKDRKRRHLGDCLIRSIANRLNYDVFTIDKGFPR